MRILTKKEKVAVWVAVIVALVIFVFAGIVFNDTSKNQLLTNDNSLTTNNSSIQIENIASSTATTTLNQLSQTKNMTQTLSDGLIITDEVVGTGAEAKSGSQVTVNYTGTFTDSKKFDSSLDPGRTPFQFTLGAGQVIAGWDEGVVGMKVGGKRKLIIPSALAYGANDYGPIPGGSTLVFEVELLGIR